jgi:hypothetical protein
MNYDLLSEFLLAGVTLGITWHNLKSRPGVAIGTLIIGLAALLGALIFAGVKEANGPHAFLALLASCAALPLLALSLVWRDGDLATRLRASVSFFIIASAVCLWMTDVLQFAAWGQIIPALSALLIMLGALQSKKLTAILGGLILLGCFALSLLQFTIYPLDSEQQLHILLSAALLLLTVRANQ